MITVVVPLYNKAGSIGHTIQTVLSQTFQDFEIVIVDDGSTDSSVTEVQRFSDSRIRIISQANAGVSAARNRGIAEAKGEYVAFLDADDRWMPGYLDEQMSLASKYQSCAIFGTNYYFSYPNGHKSSTILRKIPFKSEDGVLSNYFEVACCSHPPLWTSAIMARKNVLEEVGGFPIGVASGEDILTWAKIAVRHGVAFSLKPLAVYNLGEGYDMKNLPPRRQDAGDPVGKALLKIHAQFPDTIGLRKYISHWHKMRASVAIRYGERSETFKETAISLWYNPLNYKVAPFAILAILPKKIRTHIISRHH